MAAIHQLEPCYYEAWNDFCQEHHWFWSSTHWQEYTMCSKFGVEFINHSFFTQENGKITAVVPLIQEWDQLISPGFEDRKEILEEVRRIALENGIKRIQVNSQIKEYLNIGGYTTILDLEDIRMRKGHKAAVSTAEKYLTFHITDEMGRFKKDYTKIAGRATRPAKTFWSLLGWTRQGYGSLLDARFEGQIVGYIYVLHWLDRAYYFMSCTFEQFKKYNVNHFLLWKTFDLLRLRGVRYFDLGDQPQNSLHGCPTEKEVNIAKFKRGFGGKTVIRPASEYFFCKKTLEESIQKRLDEYLEIEYGHLT